MSNETQSRRGGRRAQPNLPETDLFVQAPIIVGRLSSSTLPVELPRFELDQEPGKSLAEKYLDPEVLELTRYSQIFHPSRDHVNISDDDLPLVKGSPGDLIEIIDYEDVE